MAQICFNIPDASVPDFQDAFADRGNYNPTKDGPKTAFARAQHLSLIKNIVSNYLASKAAKTAEDSSRATTDANLILS